MRNYTCIRTTEKAQPGYLYGDAIVFTPRLLGVIPNSEESCHFRFAFQKRNFDDSLPFYFTLSFFDVSTDQELFNKYANFFRGRTHYMVFEGSKVNFHFSADSRDERSKNIQRFIELFLSHYNLCGSDISIELYSLCGVSRPEDDIFQSLLAELDKKGVKDTIESAISYQEKGYFEIIWNLAQHLSKIAAEEKPTISIEARDLWKLYSNISEKNPHYLEAQKWLLANVFSREVTTSNKLESLEEKFRLALVGNDSWLADRVYTELCGFPFSEKPIVENVSGDYESLRQMAFHMRSMQEEMNKLKSANEDLRSQLSRKESKTSAEPELKESGSNDSEKDSWSPKMFRESERGAEGVKGNSTNLDVNRVKLENL